MNASEPLTSRVPEPELMDDAHQVAAYAGADFSCSDQALVDWIAERWPQGLGAEAVDLGCGPGNISLLLVQQWPGLLVTGVDGAQRMLAVAAQRQQVLPAQCADRLAWHLACLQTLQLGRRFSAVISNSLLHHLHAPQVLWRAVQQLASPGAAVVIHDLRRPGDEGQLQHLLHRHAADAPAVLRRDYEASLRAAFTASEVREQLQQAGLEGLEVIEREDRYLTVAGVLRSPG
jgi:trans-aconitate 2-methyltransferase